MTGDVIIFLRAVPICPKAGNGSSILEPEPTNLKNKKTFFQELTETIKEFFSLSRG